MTRLLPFVLALLARPVLAAQDLVADQPIEVALTADDAVLAGHGPSRTFEYDLTFEGTLYVWAAAADGDPFLRASDSDGELLAEDDDSGGATTARLTLEVGRNELVTLEVAAKPSGARSTVTLNVSEAPETSATRDAAARAWDERSRALRARESGDFDGARAILAASVKEALDVPGARRSTLAITAVEALGIACFESTDYASARAAFGAVREFRERVMHARQRELQDARIDLAVSLVKVGELVEARELFRSVLQVFDATLPHDSPTATATRQNLAVALKELGDLDEARALEEVVLRTWTRVRSDDDPQVQRARMNLGTTLYELGELAAARDLEERALAVDVRTLPDDHASLQILRGNLGLTILRLGDRTGARALFEKVLEVRSRTLSEDDPDLLGARQNLALVLREQGELASARELDEQVLEVRSRIFPPDHPELQDARLNLAATLCELGELAEARSLGDQVLEVDERTLPADHPGLQLARLHVACTAKAMGDLAAARPLFEKVLEVRSRTLPADHPDLICARHMLAEVTIGLGDSQAFAALAASYLESLREASVSMALQLSPREIEARAGNASEHAAIALAFAELAESVPDATARTIALLETLRTASLTSSRLLALTTERAELKAARDEVRARSEQVARLARSGRERDLLATAIADQDKSQRALLEALARPDARGILAEPSVAALSSTCDDGEALVGYWRYERFPAGDAAKGMFEIGTESVLAYVIRRDGTCARIELGPLAPIEAAVSAWRRALGSSPGRGEGGAVGAEPSKELDALGEGVRQLVFDPVRRSVGEARRLVIALDDVLHAVPFDALPLDGGLLGDRYRIETRATLRELLWEDAPFAKAGTLLALGDADFDRDPVRFDADPQESPEHPPVRRSDVAALLRGSAWEQGFEPLTFSGPEARGVAALYESAHAGEGAVRVLERRKASLASVEELAAAARYLHLATHGWFAAEALRSARDPDVNAKRAGNGPRMSFEEQVSGASPMALCGLALAGANLPQDAVGRRPGLVTAEEIASWDLRNCELAVLSACDTNVGVRRAGQGVASLQKALHMAGARSVITSLWKVPDEATKDLMLDFYRRLWVAKQPKAQALWEAKMSLRAERDANGRAQYSTRDWAAWVLTGDSR